MSISFYWYKVWDNNPPSKHLNWIWLQNENGHSVDQTLAAPFLRERRGVLKTRLYNFFGFESYGFGQNCFVADKLNPFSSTTEHFFIFES